MIEELSLLEKNKKYVWQPFTQMKEWVENEQLIIERGEGVKLYDTEGNSYYDGVSSIWLNVHGHQKKELNDAIKEQLEKISHTTMLGLANVPATELAEKLVQITPGGLNKVFYSDSGSTAVEIGLKMAFQYWQQIDEDCGSKDKFITLKNAYHGDTVGSVSVGGVDLFHKIYRPLLFDSLKAPSPYCYRCSFGEEEGKCNFSCIKELERMMKDHHREIAALVIEPLVQGAGGMITAPKGYLSKARELCDKYNILMLTDEVAVGFGRTGKMFACEHEGVSPDIMTVAKGISGGYLPISATLTTDEIYNAFYDDYASQKTFFHGHSFTGNPLAAAVSLANIDLFEKEEIIKKLQDKIKLAQNKLESFKELKHVGDIRQQGLMVGIELVKDKKSKEEYPWEQRKGVKVCMVAREKGMIIRPLGNVVVFMPPLCSTKEELTEMLEIIYESIVEVTE
ncbi:adenosylmethionine-8-amino-7-oxononanoate aminotransferase [Orenia metallireducens]|uniref:Adenosylmethionine-8-amino-7-oxononanoate aminotransferase n=1 Tax=Orenia metallireducens TaxID=1413210 RepID=A0A285FXZ0_9FIRM|nr:adenosylmethionine--8-amino-7-oxononanoate transaminase [Orenia metallireducens]PRX35577.1 adenosylmethionine-8-amino-7-oxononanoate aminotransferase [Orenia metallireducens]SNY15953.1 adenosylmethionine-8-amino-7-oxononanoate aminotransferase apoenzyme [Orenia metallireducens]